MVKRCVIADVRRTCTVPGTAYAFLQFDDFPAVFATGQSVRPEGRTRTDYDS